MRFSRLQAKTRATGFVFVYKRIKMQGYITSIIYDLMYMNAMTFNSNENGLNKKLSTMETGHFRQAVFLPWWEGAGFLVLFQNGRFIFLLQHASFLLLVLKPGKRRRVGVMLSHVNRKNFSLLLL